MTAPPPGRSRKVPAGTPTFLPNAQAFRCWLERHSGSAMELLVRDHEVSTNRPSMSCRRRFLLLIEVCAAGRRLR